MEKTCLKCGKEKPISEFYSFKRDGELKPTSQCKKCICATVDRRRKLKESTDPDWVMKEAERHRKKQEKYRKLGRANVSTGAKKREVMKRWEKNNPLKYAAKILCGNSIRDGKLIPKNCEVCGKKKTDAHHEDYTKPLEVHWLCRKHHTERHVEINDAKRRAKVEAARAKLNPLVLT